MGELIATTVRPFNEAEGSSFAFSGPDVVLPAKAALAFGMAVHELCTNAAKYGSLSIPGGHVVITWSLKEAVGGGGPQLEFTWTEEGGPPVLPPERSGFGSKMIERALAAELGAKVVLAYQISGVTCTITAPLDRLTLSSGERAGT